MVFVGGIGFFGGTVGLFGTQAADGFYSTDAIQLLHDGVEALDFFFAMGRFQGRDIRQIPALILLDLKLPKINGLELLEKLRTEALMRQIPVVVLTTSIESQDVVSSYRLGANSYIRKPVDFNEFTETIRKIVDYWLSLNFPAPEPVT